MGDNKPKSPFAFSDSAAHFQPLKTVSYGVLVGVEIVGHFRGAGESVTALRRALSSQVWPPSRRNPDAQAISIV
jgi:hypothetical protein